MNDTDAIKAGVELADGWYVVSEEAETRGGWIAHPSIQAFNVLHDPENMPQLLIDALAAQLVRQVDINFAFASDLDKRSRIIRPSGYCVGYADGDDRSMNTIRAITESGVLA